MQKSAFRRGVKRQIWRWRGVLVSVPLAVVSLMALRYGGLLETLELAALDQLFLMRPAEPVDERIVLITIDEADIKALGTWPMPDAILAQLLRQVRSQQPQIIGLDLYRDLPIPPGESELREVLEASLNQGPKIIGVQKLVGSDDSSAVPPQPILGAANRAWANDFATEPDGATRRVPVYLSLPNQPSLFSFSFVLACQYLEHQANQYCLQASPEQPVTVNQVPLPQLRPSSGGYQRDETGGYFLLVNYRGPKAFARKDIHCRRQGQRPEPTTFRAICLEDVLAGHIPAGVDLRDRIVIIGPTAQSLNDLFYTPYSSNILNARRERMPGMVIHANATSQLLAAALEGRPLLKTWSGWEEELWIIVWACVGAGLSWKRGYLDSRYHQGRGRLLGEIAALMLLLGLSSYGAFLLGWWLPLLPALLALSGTAIAINAYIAHTATEIRKIFGRYVTDQVVATLLENPGGLRIGGERCRVTILTSDLRGFTATSEQLPPEEVVEILNRYLSAMTDVIEAHGGTIDKFMGDGILVLFGAPTEAPDDATRAIACAIAMQQAMASVNQQIQQLNPRITLEMGIGLNTGDVVVGNIGSEKHTQYSVIGRHVNLAYRIEGFTVGGQVLISDATRQATHARLELGECTQVQAKGIREPITVYEVLGLGKPFYRRLPESKETFTRLPSPLTVQYQLLDEKQICPEPQLAQITAISSQSAWLDLPANAVPLQKLSNLKLSLTANDAMTWGNDDLYAKVTRCESATHPQIPSPSAPAQSPAPAQPQALRALIRFTARGTTLGHWIHHYRQVKPQEDEASSQSSP